MQRIPGERLTTGGGGLAGVDMADDHDVDMELLFTVRRGSQQANERVGKVRLPSSGIQAANGSVNAILSDGSIVRAPRTLRWRVELCEGKRLSTTYPMAARVVLSWKLK
jgi:hypothetical protein